VERNLSLHKEVKRKPLKIVMYRNVKRKQPYALAPKIEKTTHKFFESSNFQYKLHGRMRF
jgi:hypothetical protein